ncbi:hypothetical protein B0I35DRAFT_478607 [Stachybotrys elegans]|uniref:Uncharacterized protein n=1 Tax=Stachybotrys elegans TaxID=80388 RepID=A0A8K0WRI2_9HYPO|nr:hypothetical protein B0I35DRAFT_478607 [Stachybotrys elegans]
MAAARDIKFLIALLLAGVAAADDGDDFSNNLFSDLAPLLALFGERVTMQFMSQSMGWADNFILAMAPLGIITAVVSAIRVGGPSWLKAIIGRARENLAAAEADLMSSTSEEVCELWNGREVQTKTVSDQVFESFAVFAHDDRVFITTSRRANNKDDSDDDSDDEFDDEPKAKSKDKSAPSGNMGVQTAPVNKGHSILLQTKTIVGTMISLSGFIIQFVGLRGMHWSVSIAQLGAVLVMAGLRAWVRRGLANPPNCRRLSSRFELDWFAMTLADLGTAPWMDPSEDDDTKHSGPCCEWSVETGGDPDIHQPFEERKGTDEGEDVRPLSNAQRVMTIRRDLGELADWLGPATAQAVAIARSIEITMDSLFQHVPEKNYSWSLKACGGESVKFRLDRQQNGRWKAYADEIEAALSLWLYSVSEKERDHGQEQRKQTALESPHSKDDAWLRAKGSPAKRSLRLLGPNKGALHQDLQWWMPDGATQVAKVHLSEPTGGDETWMEVERHRIVGSGNRSGLDSGYRIWEPPESASDDIASYDIAHGDDEANSLLAIELYGPLESLYAQDMFSSFMWAAAKTLKEPVNGHADIRPKDISDDDAWKSFTFRNDNLSRMAHDIQSTGLGSLEDIFLCILPPLSVEHKLPKSDAIIDLAREQAKRQEQLKHWDKAAAAYIWLFRTAKIFPQQSGIATKATALLIEYLRQVTSSIKLKKAQFDIMYIYILRDVERRLRKELKTIDQGALSGFIRLYEDQGRGWKCDLVHEDNSADTTYPATFNVTELHRLAQTLEVDLQELYLSGKRRRRVNLKDIYDWTPLHYAAAKGCPDAVETLTDVAADVNARDLLEWTPLHYAWADVEAKDNSGRTILHWAAIGGHKATARLLAEEPRADIGVKDKDGMTPLHWAVMCDREAVARLLVQELGADIEAKDNDGMTPLHWAGTEAIARLLVELGADEEAKDNKGQGPSCIRMI